MNAFGEIISLTVRQGGEKFLRTQFARSLYGIRHVTLTRFSFLQAVELTCDRLHRIGVQGEKSGARIDGAIICGDKMPHVM